MMENNSELIEPMLERLTNFGKTGIELLRLKTIDKTSDIVSTIIPNSIFIFLVVSFSPFFSVGLAFLLGDIFDSNARGFILVSAFYGHRCNSPSFYHAQMDQKLSS
jgi:hypothetical protein